MTKEARTDNQFLLDIIDAIKSINDFLVDKTREEFENNYMLQSAIIRQFEIIGEAAGKLSKALKENHQEIDWPKIIGMRHKMIHDYFEVSLDVVWNTIQEDLPIFEKQIKNLSDLIIKRSQDNG